MTDTENDRSKRIRFKIRDPETGKFSFRIHGLSEDLEEQRVALVKRILDRKKAKLRS